MKIRINAGLKVGVFGTKIVALLTRTVPKDLYDVYNMVRYGLFDESEWDEQCFTV